MRSGSDGRHGVTTSARRAARTVTGRHVCVTALLLASAIAVVATPATAGATRGSAEALSAPIDRRQPAATAAPTPTDLTQRLSPARPGLAVTGHQAIRVALGEPLWTIVIAVTEIVARTLDVARRLVESLLDAFRTAPKALAGIATLLGTTLVAAVPHRPRNVPDGRPESLAKS